MLTFSKPSPRSERTSRESELLAKVDRLLRAGRPGEAVEAIGLAYLPCPRIANALAVCHLRLGNTVRALRLLRHIATSGTALRPDVPTVFKTNLAAALLAVGDVTGCIRTLDEIGDEDRPSVKRLRATAAAWAAPRTAWGRWLRRIGIGPFRPPALEGSFGELEDGDEPSIRPADGLGNRTLAHPSGSHHAVPRGSGDRARGWTPDAPTGMMAMRGVPDDDRR